MAMDKKTAAVTWAASIPLFILGQMFFAGLCLAQTPRPVVVVAAQDLNRLASQAQAKQDGANPARPQVIEPIISADSYVLNLERHVGKGPGSLHPIWAELIVVLQGTGTVATGGSVVEGVTSADGNVHGSDIAGGIAQHVAPGDLMIVPQGVAHILISDAGVPLIVATLHVPRNGVDDPESASRPAKLVHLAAGLPAAVARASTAAQPDRTMLSLPPYQMEMERPTAAGMALLHQSHAEFIFVRDGEGELISGGALSDARALGGDTLTGTIQGGLHSRLERGAIVYVPKNVPFVAKSGNRLTLATMLVPVP
jgi:mannose-6-phosphate isomerase-like protein (cupin superfamily)